VGWECRGCKGWCGLRWAWGEVGEGVGWMSGCSVWLCGDGTVMFKTSMMALKTIMSVV
jgi:hypothetical protein